MVHSFCGRLRSQGLVHLGASQGLVLEAESPKLVECFEHRGDLIASRHKRRFSGRRVGRCHVRGCHAAFYFGRVREAVAGFGQLLACSLKSRAGPEQGGVG